ncbi:putative major facilitator superfamily transporter [Cladophialophora carrionii]|uniref:Putative major facilitator superfamily transporter n=1 Tax=Cladophialophora carrionii TaxID=86049 RepID=A0A1C1C9I6_9EURO|nr:putative major facilitator superfamily transporter [Cladophialophora carrionii]
MTDATARKEMANRSEEIESAPAPRQELGMTEDIEDDPHRAALELNPEVADKITWSTTLSVFFLGLSFTGCISTAFLLASSILVPIGTALGDLVPIGWIASSWAVTSAVSMSLGGGLSDIFGRRYVIMAGQLLNIVGAIVSATAQKVTHVIAGSAVVGFGAGLVFVAYAGIPEILPNKYRGMGLAWTEFCITIPWGLLATLLANQLNEHATWRWVYYLSIIYAAVCFVGTAIFYFPPARPRKDYDKTRWEEFCELDFIGYTLYAGGLTVFLIGLSWAGEEDHAWNSASVVAPIVLGGLVFIGTFVYDWTVKPKLPLMPLHIFRMVREFTILLVALFVSGMVFFAMVSLLPQATESVYDSDPIKLGVALIPNGVGQFIGGAVLPALVHKIKHIRAQIVVALCLQTLFSALYAYGIIPHHKAAWVIFQFFGMMCFSWITLCSYVVVGLHVPHRDLGIASGLVGTFRNTGGSVGISIFNTIRNGVLGGQLVPRILAAATANGFRGDADATEALVTAVTNNARGVPGAFAEIQGATPALIHATAEAYKSAYGYAYQRVFFSTIPFGVIAIIAAFFIKDASEYLTNHTAVNMEKNVLGERPQTNKAVDVEQPEKTAT